MLTAVFFIAHELGICGKKLSLGYACMLMCWRLQSAEAMRSFLACSRTDSVKRLEDEGASSVKTIAELAAQSDTVISMLPSSPHVMDVYNRKVCRLALAAPEGLGAIDRPYAQKRSRLECVWGVRSALRL